MMLLHCSPHDTFVIIKALAENFKACTSRSLFLLKRGRRIVLTSFKLYIVVTTRCTTKHTNQQLSCFLLYIAVHTLATKCTSGMENRYYKKILRFTQSLFVAEVQPSTFRYLIFEYASFAYLVLHLNIYIP